MLRCLLWRAVFQNIIAISRSAQPPRFVQNSGLTPAFDAIRQIAILFVDFVLFIFRLHHNL